MPADDVLASLERVREVAEEAGLKGEIDRGRALFQMAFQLPDDRRQQVFVRDSSTAERRVVNVFSPCLEVRKGLLSGLTKEIALDLLETNEKLQFARYGIWESENATTVVASCDCLLETLDPAELHNAAWSVAFAADLFEHKHGKDEF